MTSNLGVWEANLGKFFDSRSAASCASKAAKASAKSGVDGDETWRHGEVDLVFREATSEMAPSSEVESVGKLLVVVVIIMVGVTIDVRVGGVSASPASGVERPRGDEGGENSTSISLPICCEESETGDNPSIECSSSKRPPLSPLAPAILLATATIPASTSASASSPTAAEGGG